MPAPAKRYSRYLTMRDGALLAVDVAVPVHARSCRVPAIVHQTRYFRGTDWRPPWRFLGLAGYLDIHAPTRAAFLAAGYAWVDVDVRGSGASTGSRPCPWSADETRDGFEVVEWVVRQPWCDGNIGSTGISYGGTCADFLATEAHPAVKAIAPRFSLYDVFTDVAFPGGLHLHWFTENWSAFNRALDDNNYERALGRLARIQASALRDYAHQSSDRRLAIAAAALGSDAAEGLVRSWIRFASGGVSPVNGDRAAIRRAVDSHRDNIDVHAGALKVTYRDDRGMSPSAPELTIDDFSPHTRLADLRNTEVAVYGVSGWLDGAYQNAAIKRHLNLPRGRGKLRIGPWDHGGRQDVSPFSNRRLTDFDYPTDLIRFFDRQLRGVHLDREDSSVSYFTMGAERWRASDRWPPDDSHELPWFLAADRSLEPRTPERDGSSAYRVDPRTGTGARSRWRSYIGIAAPVGYGNRRSADERMLFFTSAPLTEPLEVTGHPLVHLFVSFDGPDAAVFAYLEDVAPSGDVTYVTEGELRVLHRRQREHPEGYTTAGPYRSFKACDGRPIMPGEVVELVFDLLPTSYEVPPGHAIRLSLAGADCDHFAALAEGASAWDLRWGKEYPSRLVLPVARRACRW